MFNTNENVEDFLSKDEDSIFIPHADGNVPPMITINGEKRRLVHSSGGSTIDTLNRFVAPTNIIKDYVGLPNTTVHITPSGGEHISGEPVDYIFYDDQLSVLGYTSHIFTYPSTLGEIETYYVAPFFNGVGPMIEFTIGSVNEVVPTAQLLMSELQLGMPSELYPGFSSVLRADYNVINLPTGETVSLYITGLSNITLDKLNAIDPGETINYTVHNASFGDVVIEYHYETSAGKRTGTFIEVIKNNISTNGAVPYNLIDNFPSTLAPNDIFTWRYGNVANGVTLEILSMMNLYTTTTGVIQVGQDVTLEVTGTEGEVVTMTYGVLFNGSMLGATTVTSIIGAERLDTTGFHYSSSPDESTLTAEPPNNVLFIRLRGMPGLTRVNMQTPNRYCHIDNGDDNYPEPTYTLTVAREYDPHIPLTIPVVLIGNENGVEKMAVEEINLTVNKSEGFEAIGLSRIFTKPSGVTSLTIVTSGGANNEDTNLTGLIHYTFPGALYKPSPTSRTFSGLTTDEETITFDLATGTSAFVSW